MQHARVVWVRLRIQASCGSRSPLMIPVLLLLLAALTTAYIPASPTNSTQDAIAGGLNITDISKLRLQWYSNGSVSSPFSCRDTSHSLAVIMSKTSRINSSAMVPVASVRCAAVFISIRLASLTFPPFQQGILIHFSEESVNETVPPSAPSLNTTELPMLIWTSSIRTLDCHGLL
jgi:hypothetical protein